MFHPARLCQFQQTVNGVDIIFLKQVINRRRALHPLIHTSGEYQTVTSAKVGAKRLIAHFQVIPVHDFHLRWKNRAFRQRRQSNGRNLVSTLDEYFRRFTAQ